MPRRSLALDEARSVAEMDSGYASYSGIERALRIINAVADTPPQGVGVSALARHLSLSKAVTHRILKSLTYEGFLAFNEETKRYSLGVGALKVGLAAVRLLDIPATAKPYLQQLVDETHETATLSIRNGWSRMYLDQVLSPKEVRMSVSTGQSYSLHAGASSKAILAALPDVEIEEYLRSHKLERLTPATIISDTQLRADGQVFGSLSVCGPIFRIDASVQRRVGIKVREASRDLSRSIGYQG
jgi:IclR family transcriptional regulator, acetate operon repressor